jgi:hypothetical protein
MKLPERLEVQVLADEKRAAGMFVCVTIRTTRKSDFGLGFGPTNEAGELVILRSDLLREAEKERALFIMDYGHPEDDFAGEIVVKPLNRNALQQAITAYDTYQQVTPYPRCYGEQIQEARASLEKWKPRTLRAEVKVEDGAARVRGEATAA